MTPWPDIPTVLAIHSLSLRRFGGADGVRDMRLLESALTQPLATFHGVDLYPSGIMKAARLAYGIIRNHPFHDGNKRTGAALWVLSSSLTVRNSSPRTWSFLT